MQIRSTQVFYFEKYFENTILFCIFKILFRSILHITVHRDTERGCNACKTPRTINPSNFNRFWDSENDIARKLQLFLYPLHLTPILGETPFEFRENV